jgi:uncharacterized protein YodC (DUF2158 family)
MAEQWKVGDVVQLKSGGPIMTVLSTGSQGCRCSWFDHAQKPSEHVFPSEALERYRAPRFEQSDDA